MKNHPHIALILHADQDFFGGVARVLIELANNLCAGGLKVELVVTNAKGVRPADLDSNVTIHDLGASGLKDAFLPLIWYLRDTKPEVVLSAMEHPNLMTIVAHKIARSRARLIVSTHGSLDSRLSQSWGARDRRLIRTLLPMLYPFADAIVAVSDGVADELRRLVPRAGDRVHRIYNPIRIPKVGAKAAQRSPGDIPLVISAGRFSPEKDYSLLFEAIAIANQRRPLKLVLLGEGPERSKLEDSARELGVWDHVELPGWSQDLVAWMRAADLFVLSSRSEGFGNVLVEAMACGCPVVSTDCPYGPREILDDGSFGQLVPVGDAEALANAMIASLETPHDPTQLRARAQVFSIERSMAGYRKVLGVEPEAKAPDRYA